MNKELQMSPRVRWTVFLLMTVTDDGVDCRSRVEGVAFIPVTNGKLNTYRMDHLTTCWGNCFVTLLDDGGAQQDDICQKCCGRSEDETTY